MKYGLLLIVLAAMLISLASVVPVQAAAAEQSGIWNIPEFCGAGPLCVGLKERLRQEGTHNVADFNTTTTNTSDPTMFFRTRSQLYADWKISDFDAVRLQLTNEFRNYFQPDTRLTRGNPDEIFIDHLFVNSKEIFESPVSLQVGRFELLNQYGDNFIFADGTPNDGSRSMFFDAVKASISIDDNNTLDILYISNDMEDDKLPRINAQDSDTNSFRKKTLNMADESGPAVIWKSKISDALYIEPYYVFKNEDPGVTARELDINTIGSYVKYKIDDVTVRAQLAFQFGEYGKNAAGNTVDREGMGGYIFADKQFKDVKMKPKLSVGYMYLSGDDPNTTDKIEAWDPLYSRSTLFDEMYYYATKLDDPSGSGQTGYWTNLMAYFLKCGLTVKDPFTVDLGLAYYMAAEGNVFGDRKGLSPNITLGYKFSKAITGRWQFFYFIPDDFYTANGNQNNAYFFRAEIAMSF